MPDTPKEKQSALNAADWKAIAEFIKSEKERRATARSHKEKMWDEVDRQLRMEAKPRVIASGTAEDWFPNIELPLQFDTLEVTVADVKRLAFPRGTEWYNANAELSDEYIERFERRRETKPLIGSRPIPAKLDQETANTLVKTAIDHYHRLFDFRANVIAFAIEAAKYGSAVARVREVNHPQLSNDFRGVKGDMRGPAMIPCSIKSTYLDDSPHSVMHEGISSAPSTIRGSFQQLEKLTKAARQGGKKRGWMIGQIKELVPLECPRDCSSGEQRGASHPVQGKPDAVPFLCHRALHAGGLAGPLRRITIDKGPASTGSGDHGVQFHDGGGGVECRASHCLGQPG
jgi:hypothetical protein